MTRVVLYGASWCGQCHVLRPRLEEECKRLELPMAYMDCDGHEDEVAAVGVRNIPAVRILKDNGDVVMLHGVNAWRELESWL